MQVIGTELFGLLREKRGKQFQAFVEDKVVALAGDIISENLGLEEPMLQELAKDIDVIVNIAATTNFYERYDVSLDVNVMGVKHLCQFAKQCAKLKMFMQVSTAYVSGDRAELIQEKPIKLGEALREGRYLDIDAELDLVMEAKEELKTCDDAKKKTERKAMKELGIQRARHFGWSNTYVFTKAMGEMLLGQLRGDMPVVIMRPSIITSVQVDPLPGWMQGTRTIDTLIIGYAEQNLSCFLGDLSVVVDVIPGDMVVNAMMAAMVAHSEEKGTQAIYHATSSLGNPATYAMLYEAGRRHFYQNPRVGKNGEVIPTKEMYFFNSIARFRLFMFITYKLPLEILHLVNLLLCGLFSRLYNDMNRKYKFVMHLVDVYGPFAFFRACYDDMNLERLRSKMTMKTREDQMFNFDPRTINWEEYFYRIHIPGVLKCVCMQVTGTELFFHLREKHGKGFQEFVEEKVFALAGDIIYLGLGAPMLEELPKDVDVIVNIAASTNFYERYDVSLDVDVMGVKHLCQFAKQCAHLKMLMHVSTGQFLCVRGQGGPDHGEAIGPGESLREGTYLDIDAELRLVREVKMELAGSDDAQKTERKAMKELGLQRAPHFGWSNTYVFTKAIGEMLLGQLRGDMPVVIMRPSIIISVREDPLPGWMQGTRTIDTIITGYAKQNISCFLADLRTVMDVIPGKVVNAMMAHSKKKGVQAVYHATSSPQNPANYNDLYQGGRQHFYETPRLGKNGEDIPTKEMYFFNTIARFHLYMILTFKILHLVNLLLCGLFSRLYNDLNRKYKFVMHLVDVYGPFAMFKGCSLNLSSMA
ncbi:hypothetical protein EJB05_47667 [Eragrostis curvula]|uniref:Fatty acyl-CoA reductase n=1 Tax=Eragrostis curvula TaxID=38414 RepID=A0A5J9SZW3_9POAL|nr:hypothetical protein EJB05_47667 [Eragrostis curvula]